MEDKVTANAQKIFSSVRPDVFWRKKFFLWVVGCALFIVMTSYSKEPTEKKEPSGEGPDTAYCLTIPGPLRKVLLHGG